MTDEARFSRRDVLALVGATALAGCGGLPGLGEESVELDGEAVADVASGETPTIAGPLPVDVGDGYLADSRERAESALASAPLPLTAEEMPNEVMRERLAAEVEHARDLLDAATEAPGVRERLGHLGHAREHARFVATAWAYANDEVALADVRDRAETVRTDAKTYREGWAYVGTDPVRALLVGDAVEAWTGTARRYATLDDPGQYSTANALGVGERAGSVEHGRAYLADARRVGDRYAASLADPPSVRETFATAHESLAETLETRRDGLPGPDVHDPNDLVDVDRDLQGTPAGVALDDLHWRASPSDEPDEPDEPAGDVVERSFDLAGTVAFRSLRDRVAGGETFTVESADELRERRSSAVSAFESAIADSDDRRLARRLLADRSRWFDDVDRDLDRYGDTVSARSLEYEIGRYVELAAFARAVPEAVAETLDALDAA